MTSRNAPPPPKRSEVWIADLDPTVGSEMRKTRHVIVLNSDGVGALPIRLVAPVKTWRPQNEGKLWLVRIDPTSANGLTWTGAVDVLQLRGLDLQRFVRKVGRVSASMMEEITAAVAAIIEYR